MILFARDRNAEAEYAECLSAHFLCALSVSAF